MRHILHVDMNSFFASCEQANCPALKKRPLIVAGDPERRHGIVLAASYDAKGYGVKTTMPVWKALQLCPNAQIIKPNYRLYSELSQKVMQLFDEYTPIKEQLSIDEAFLDMTGTETIFGETLKIAKQIQNRIYQELDLCCSVGVSSNKFLAKMASDMKKPMGITVLYPDQIAEKMWILPVETLYGVGKSTKAVFHKMHIYTIGDLARYDLSELIRRLGEKKARTVHQHANGIDETPVIPNEESETKSVGNEITFSTDITDFCELKKEILTLAESVGWRLRKLKTYGKTITLKIKYDDFSLVTRSKTLDLYMDQTDLIYEEAIQLLNKHWQKKRGVRLLGITVSNLDQEKETEQLCLFDLKPKADPKKEKLDQTIDALRGKYGYNILRRASLLDAKHKVKKIQS